jgi:hydrogenase maturation factor
MMAGVDAGIDLAAPEREGPAEELAAAAVTVARRFAAGATMWCVAPEWPAHGRHVAVEFVHPVIVGKRALPALSVSGPDTTSRLRLLARPGDILVVIGPATEQTVGLVRRAETWGVPTVWLGAGPRPVDSAATHLVWTDSDDDAPAARSGEMVLLYHVLWELTHVVFEHPGLLTEPPACTDEVCITCSDDGRVAEVRAVRDGGEAEVVAAGHAETVDVSLIDGVRPGDLVLVHAGVALETVDAGEPR